MIAILHEAYFFIVLGLLAGGYYVAKALTLRHEARLAAPPLDCRDPFAIAVLRGGPVAAIELAVVGLVDRGLVKPVGATFDADSRIVATRRDAADFASNPLERAIIEAAKSPVSVKDVAAFGAVATAADGYQRQLGESRLIVDDVYRRERFIIALRCALPAVAVILLRLFTTVEGGGGRGLAFLLGASGLIVYFVVLLTVRDKLTQGGHQLLADLSRLFGGLRDRRMDLTPARMGNDAMFCAAVFGLHALPAAAFPAAAFYVAEEDRRRKEQEASSSTSSGSSCGSSCSSSSSGCGSDSGGGDGGGGCGGGCS